MNAEGKDLFPLFYTNLELNVRDSRMTMSTALVCRIAGGNVLSFEDIVS
ncbi:MAG: hypothetical protein J6Z30_07270 [Pyramidobacter sp.]|nr:hypothetical protein [Pyramidobacter sp.]